MRNKLLVEIICIILEYICRQPQDHGSTCPLSASDIRWYYERRSGQCDSFKFAGCEGNLNNFHSLAECQTYCMGKCPEGTEPFVAPTTGQPLVCQIEVGMDLCPTGHKCTKTSTGSNLCCKTSPMCPGSSEIYLHPTMQTPVYCRLDNGVALR